MCLIASNSTSPPTSNNEEERGTSPNSRVIYPLRHVTDRLVEDLEATLKCYFRSFS